MTGTTRAIKALLDELAERHVAVPPELVKAIFETEERVQFLDERGPIAAQVAKLVEAELEKARPRGT